MKGDISRSRVKAKGKRIHPFQYSQTREVINSLHRKIATLEHNQKEGSVSEGSCVESTCEDVPMIHPVRLQDALVCGTTQPSKLQQ